jgi:hypothetical protein
VSTSLPLVGHRNFSTAIASLYTVCRNQSVIACSPTGNREKNFPRHAALLRSGTVISVCLKFTLPIRNPDCQRGLLRRFHSWPSTNGLMVLVEDFRLEGSSPEQELFSQRAADADCFNLGFHMPSLTPAHDEKIAQSTEQNGTGRRYAEDLPFAEPSLDDMLVS